MGLEVLCDEGDLCVCLKEREKETILLPLLLGWNCQSTGGHSIRESGQSSTLTGLDGTRWDWGTLGSLGYLEAQTQGQKLFEVNRLTIGTKLTCL